MGRLTDFLIANRNTIYFFALEFLALWLLIRFNANQHAVFTERFLAVAGQVQAMNAGVKSYFNLRAQNEMLLLQNVNLRRRLLEMERAYSLKPEPDFDPFEADTAKTDSLAPPAPKPEPERYQYVPCRVIGKSIYSSYNFLSLNVGARHGVKPEMGVVGPDGVAGVVVAVRENYALAMSILNKNFRLSARIKGKRQEITGSFAWNGGDPRFGALRYVPQHYQINVGDTVVTSGYSAIFPPGLPIGVIESFDVKGADGFYDVKVRLSVDFHLIDYVYLVQNEHKAQIDSLRRYVEE